MHMRCHADLAVYIGALDWRSGLHWAWMVWIYHCIRQARVSEHVFVKYVDVY